MKITACVVVYNEEKFIAPCLKSLIGAVDEIIVVHDGECKDQTLAIASRYTSKIFVRPHHGFMERHLVFAFTEASGDWILRIDADEVLSPELAKNLRPLAMREDVDAYEFLWPTCTQNQPVGRTWNYKSCFFRKEKAVHLGITHYPTLTTGVLKRSDLVLEHHSLSNDPSRQNFQKKALPWARKQAESYLRDFSEVEKFNYPGSQWPLTVRLRVRFPRLIMPLDFFAAFFKIYFLGAWRNGLHGFKMALDQGIYRVALDYYIMRFKNSAKSSATQNTN